MNGTVRIGLISGCYEVDGPVSVETRITPEMIAPEHRKLVMIELLRLALLSASIAEMRAIEEQQLKLRKLIGVRENG